MNTQGLSLDTIPPAFIPLRFFLTAPLFGIFAALLILYNGSEIWISRWTLNSLALTHLLTVGFMLMIMIGALYQFIPVMIGRLIPASKKLAPVIHLLLSFGTLFLASAFLSQGIIFYALALAFLGLAVLLFALSLAPLLVSALKDHLIVFLLRILYFILLVTIGLGLFMLLAYVYPEWQLPFRNYTDTHALWGLLGWVVLLIMAVSSQVIPMFYLTPEFSVKTLKILSVMILFTLILMFLFAHILITAILSLELLFFSIYTLSLINQRKRKISDVTIHFFRLALSSLIFTLLVWWVFIIALETLTAQYYSQLQFTLGVLLIYGLALSAIIGMLQKIVPFLIYLNLQRLSFKHPGSITLIPNMKKIISTRYSKIQFYLHLSSFCSLLLSIYWPQITAMAGVLMLINFCWLSFIVLQGGRIYRQRKTEIVSFPEIDIQF